MATFKIILYKQKVLSGDCHPVMLQVTHSSRSFRISLGHKCKLTQWDFHQCKFKRNFKGYPIKNKLLRAVIDRAEDTQDEMHKLNKPFTPQLFRDLFLGTKKEIGVFDFFDELIKEMEEQHKFGNRNVYMDTRNALKRYRKSKKRLMFPDIDYAFLKKFEVFLSATASGGGIAVYMRTIRAAYNEAIRRDYAEGSHYPFSTTQNKNGYSLNHLKSTASPRALSLDDMDKFKNFSYQEHLDLENAYWYFLFSYYARGMNFADMGMLQWSNIYDERISYNREKTGKFYTIKVSDTLADILAIFKAKKTCKYVFPVLSDFHQTLTQKKNRIKKCLKQYNGHLKEIAEICGIDANVTSYVARHTFATTLKRKNANISLISEAMGHTDINTTKAYLKKFENAALDSLDELL